MNNRDQLRLQKQVNVVVVILLIQQQIRDSEGNADFMAFIVDLLTNAVTDGEEELVKEVTVREKTRSFSMYIPHPELSKYVDKKEKPELIPPFLVRTDNSDSEMAWFKYYTEAWNYAVKLSDENKEDAYILTAWLIVTDCVRYEDTEHLSHEEIQFRAAQARFDAEWVDRL